MGAALCLLLPFIILSSEEDRYYRSQSYDAAYHGCKQPIILELEDENQNKKKYVARCGRKVLYGSHYCQHHQYYI